MSPEFYFICREREREREPGFMWQDIICILHKVLFNNIVTLCVTFVNKNNTKSWTIYVALQRIMKYIGS